MRLDRASQMKTFLFRFSIDYTVWTWHNFPNDLKQNVVPTQEKKYGLVFHSLSHGGISFGAIQKTIEINTPLRYFQNVLYGANNLNKIDHTTE